MGSVPPLEANSNPIVVGVMLHASSARWHVTQLRPLVPCGLKKSLVRSTDPRVAPVDDNPLALTWGKLFGRKVWPSPSLPVPASVVAAKPPMRVVNTTSDSFFIYLPSIYSGRHALRRRRAHGPYSFP